MVEFIKIHTMCGKSYLITDKEYNFFFGSIEDIEYTWYYDISDNYDKQFCNRLLSGYTGQYFAEIYRFYKTGEIYLEDRPKYQIQEILNEAETLKYQELINFIKN
jgi:hypothetical protein